MPSLRIDVKKPSSHHLSQSEIDGDNPCSRQLSGNTPVSYYGVNQDLACDRCCPQTNFSCCEPIDGRSGLPAEKWNQVPRGIEAALFDAPVRETEFVLTRNTSAFVELRKMQSAGRRAHALSPCQAA